MRIVIECEAKEIADIVLAVRHQLNSDESGDIVTQIQDNMNKIADSVAQSLSKKVESHFHHLPKL